MKKISLNSVKEYLSRDEQRQVTGGSGASFPCYCNGVFVGNASTIQGCWNMC